jgi:hypothetical protein
MPAAVSEDLFRQVSAAIARLYPGLCCYQSRQELRYLHPTEPSTLSVTPDEEGRFRVLLEYSGPFAVIVSSSTRNLSRLLDLVRDWREGR